MELGELMCKSDITHYHLSMAHRSTKNVKDRMIVMFIRREMRNELYRRRGILAAKTSNGLFT
jgi:hypothetical protein